MMTMFATTDVVLEFELGYSAVGGGAKAIARFWNESMTVEVEYRDPPGGSRPIRFGVGDFDGRNVVAADERGDNLHEVQRSYPEKWSEFCSLLPGAMLAAQVLRT